MRFFACPSVSLPALSPVHPSVCLHIRLSVCLTTNATDAEPSLQSFLPSTSTRSRITEIYRIDGHKYPCICHDFALSQYPLLSPRDIVGNIPRSAYHVAPQRCVNFRFGTAIVDVAAQMFISGKWIFLGFLASINTLLYLSTYLYFKW